MPLFQHERKKTMIKTIEISGKEVQLNNNIGWTFIYRDQFGHDIIPTLMPMIGAIIDLISGLIQETGKTDNLDVKDLIKIADSEKLYDAIIHMSGLEFVELLNITWSLAKCADNKVPEPKKWVMQFEEFPLDEIVPVVAQMIVKGIISTKNLERLQNLTANLKPEA